MMKVSTQTIRAASLLIGDHIVPDKARRTDTGLVTFDPKWRVQTINPCPTDKGRNHFHVNVSQCFTRAAYIQIVNRRDYAGPTS